MEEADQNFFARVAQGYQTIAPAEPQRVKQVDATGDVARNQTAIRDLVQPLARKLRREAV